VVHAHAHHHHTINQSITIMPSSRSQQKKRRAQRRAAERQEHDRAERRAREELVEQTAPTALEAGVYTARAQQLLLESQRRTYDERLSKAYCAGIHKLSKNVAEAALSTHTSCKVYASCICRDAFPGIPEEFHKDIYLELVERLKVHFASLGYIASTTARMIIDFVGIHLEWHSTLALQEEKSGDD
jgi:hypothetical protein